MTEVTITSIQHKDLSMNIDSGTSERRLCQVDIKVTSAGTSDTLDLSTYISGFSTILGIMSNSLDGADASNDTTLNTFATSILTTAGHAGSGVWDITLLGSY